MEAEGEEALTLPLARKILRVFLYPFDRVSELIIEDFYHKKASEKRIARHVIVHALLWLIAGYFGLLTFFQGVDRAGWIVIFDMSLGVILLFLSGTCFYTIVKLGTFERLCLARGEFEERGYLPGTGDHDL